jgi:hypothetical protein
MDDRLSPAFQHARWTQTDITTLRERVNDNTPLHELAKLLGRSPHDVQQMIDRLHLTESRGAQ